MLPEQIVTDEIISFFSNKFELKFTNKGYKYAAYSNDWLNEINLISSSSDESKTSRTLKKLQEILIEKFGEERIKVEAKVAENMQLRFIDDGIENIIDTNNLMAFDIFDKENGCAYEISLSDAFAEFFKDVLKALLDSRVKKLYYCMRNHYYSGAKKSGFSKVSSSPMIKQYINLARLYKLEIILVDLFPNCNKD